MMKMNKFFVKPRLESRVRFSGVPANCSDEALDSLLTDVGPIVKCEKYNTRDGQTRVIQVSYTTREDASKAVEKLHNSSFEGSCIRVERLMEKNSRPPRMSGMPPQNRVGEERGPNQFHPDFPLRILVLSEMVGAIIGRQGATIREITLLTRARVDVHRKENAGSVEKAVTIYGNPENCTNACKRILEVMNEEAANTNRGEIPLKILAHNNLIGRIIGKSGATIKKIMDDTNTRLTVSSIHDVNSHNLERIISIKGSIEDIARAENTISAKLRQCYENDLQSIAPQASMFPGLHPMSLMSTVGYGLPLPRGFGPCVAGGSYPPCYPGAFTTGQASASHQMETAFVYIPNTSVGAVIGTKGSHIKAMIRFSSASVKIAPIEEEQGTSSPNGNGEVLERKVTIVGTPDAQWKAQYMLYDKVKEEGYGISIEDLRLTVEILIPSTQVGRVIGKGGQSVRDLQRRTQSVIKLPQQGTNSSGETLVQIIGTFISVQSAQRRIRSIVQAAMLPATNPGPSRTSRTPPPTERI